MQKPLNYSEKLSIIVLSTVTVEKDVPLCHDPEEESRKHSE
jgi:hypothetical protein